MLYSGCRPGVVRAAEWAEFNLLDGLWEIPTGKMKKRRPHIVPLPRQMIELLNQLKAISGNNRYLFPTQGGYGERSIPFLSEGTINNAFARMGFKDKMTGHGSRHTASTLLNEHDWPGKYVDAQLSHLANEPDAPKIRGEYNHAKYLNQRNKMMQWYADYLDALEHNSPLPPEPWLSPIKS